MSVIGLGTDIVSVARVGDLLARHGERFLARCFSVAEIRIISDRHPTRRVPTVAARWAAKEAFLKALGGSIGHIPYHEISIESEPGGAPAVRVEGAAAAAMAARGARLIRISLSHEIDYAVATIILEA